MHFLGEVCGFIGGTIGVATGLPQVLRVRRLGHANGLALSPWILTCIMLAGWAGFGAKVGSPSILIFNVLTFVTSALVVTAIRGNSPKNWALLALGGLAVGLFTFLSPQAITDPILVVLTGSRFPQLVRTWINRRTVQVTAVSLSSLLVSLTSTLFWIAFAVLTQNTLIIFTSLIFIAIVSSTYIMENHIAKQAKRAQLA